MKTCGADIVRVTKEVTGAFTCDACVKIFTKKGLSVTTQMNTCCDKDTGGV